MLTTIVIGNLGANAEFHSENGNEFVSFKVAHTDRYKSSDGQDKEETVWVSCVLNGRADKLLQYKLLQYKLLQYKLLQYKLLQYKLLQYKLLQYLTKGTKVCVVGDDSVRAAHVEYLSNF